MKTKYFFFAALAGMTLASCSGDDIASNNSSTLGDENSSNGAIVFTSGANAITRADKVGADAAALLGNKFKVGGFKGDGSTTNTQVFDNYLVQWTVNTAGTTASNTSDWEYVGIAAEAPSSITGTQTIKYWDYSASQYDFAAYSLGGNTSYTEDGEPSANQIKVSKITKANATTGLTYTLKGSAEDLAECYISDMVTAYKSSNEFKKEVTLNFRSLGTKIRVGFYETVPGYSVKDVKFYTDDATTTIATGASQTSATLFIPSGDSGFGSAGTYTITFPTVGSSNVGKADYNKAHISFSGTAAATTAEKQRAFGGINYVGKEQGEAAGNYYLGRSSSAVSYAGTTSPYYTTVLPTTVGSVLELRVDYTLVSIDGSNEEIKIHGAKAFVPGTYTAWLPNYAYTYIFKISDNTNGWTSTSTDDPVGLFPITFDAVVAETTEFNAEQTTITTVATPSITTYQKGHNPSSNEYDKDKGAIYVQVMDNNASPAVLKADLDTKGQLYTLSVAKTEAEVMDALNIQVSSDATTITGRNGLVLTKATSDATITTIPGEDGNNITVATKTAASFTPAAGTYAYVYDATPTSPAPAATYIYSAESSSTKPTDWTTAGTWYKDPNGVNAVADGDWVADKVFYKRYTNLNKVYGVKIIKVVE